MKKITKKTTKKAQEYVNILGINILVTQEERLITSVKSFLSHNHHFYIVTPNPELVLASTKNPDLKRALNDSDFSVPDGVGLRYASRFLYGKDLKIIPGRKLFEHLVAEADKNKYKVFLLGGLDDEARAVGHKLKEKYKNLKIMSARGPILNKKGQPDRDLDKELEKDTVDTINKFAPDILFVAFGNPKQEIWIHDNLGKLRIGGAMAVGGTFRYLAGFSKLPPKWVEKMGLEWLWRLAKEPKRIGRILNAFPIFPLKVFFFKISHKTSR